MFAMRNMKIDKVQRDVVSSNADFIVYLVRCFPESSICDSIRRAKKLTSRFRSTRQDCELASDIDPHRRSTLSGPHLFNDDSPAISALHSCDVKLEVWPLYPYHAEASCIITLCVHI